MNAHTHLITRTHTHTHTHIHTHTLTGDNARIIYSIDPSTDVDNSFEIDSEGSLTTRSELDRETTSFYNLIVLVSSPLVT